MNVSLKHLRVFLALAQSLNFSRTAEEFYVTQPALSKLIKDLEEELGVTLFLRSTRSVKLTVEGANLLPLAHQVVVDYDGGIASMRRLALSEAHKVSIAALPSLACVLLPSVVQALQREVPDIAVTIYDGSAEATIKRLINHQVDFALAAADPSKPELRYEEVLRDRFVLLAGGEMRSLVKPVMTLSDLARLPLISMTDASTAKKYMAAAFMQRDAEFLPKMQFDQVGTIGGFVQQGIGVAVLPYLGILPLLSLGSFVISEIADGPVRSVGIVTRRDGHLSPMSAKAVDHVRTRAKMLIENSPAWLMSSTIEPVARDAQI